MTTNKTINICIHGNVHNECIECINAIVLYVKKDMHVLLALKQSTIGILNTTYDIKTRTRLLWIKDTIDAAIYAKQTEHPSDSIVKLNTVQVFGKALA